MHAPARPPTRRLPASPAAAGAAAHLSGPQAAPPRRQRPKLTRPLRLPRLHPACTLQRRLEIATYSPLTRYNFQVWARNTAGWGDPSTPPVVYRAPNVSWSRFLCVPCPFALECMHVVRAWLGLVGVRGAWRPSRPAAPLTTPPRLRLRLLQDGSCGLELDPCANSTSCCFMTPALYCQKATLTALQGNCQTVRRGGSVPCAGGSWAAGRSRAAWVCRRGTAPRCGPCFQRRQAA